MGKMQHSTLPKINKQLSKPLFLHKCRWLRSAWLLSAGCCMPLKREKGERRLNIQLPVGLSPLCVPAEGDEQEGVAAGRPPDPDGAERTRGWADMEDFREIPALLAAGPRAVHIHSGLIMSSSKSPYSLNVQAPLN